MNPNAIHFAVGAPPALNLRDDQATILRLLNRIGAGDGGPLRPLTISLKPFCHHPELVAAILKFQRFHQGRLGQAPDGRVDPDGQTLQLMMKFDGRRSIELEIPETSA